MNDSKPADEFSMVLASSVHDMKNSLTMLLGSLDEVIASSEQSDSAQARQFATLQYEAARINGELIKLLSIYRMQQQRLPVVIDEHYVAELLEDLLARNETLCASRNIQLTFRCDSELVWYFDAEMLSSVLNDAVVNAARYSKDKVELSACINGHALELRVSDNGPGFPMDMLAQQEQPLEAQAFRGERTQLGLYFAARVAELHRNQQQVGKLQLSNNGRLGGGEFLLVLP